MRGYGWAHHGTEEIEGLSRLPHPGGDGLVHGIGQGTGARGDGDHLRPQELHPGHVGGLAAHILLAHVDHAFQPEEGRGGGGGHAVHSRPGLGDDPLFPHALRQKGLPQDVVDLVGPGVVQVLPLEVHLRSSERFGDAGSEIQGGGPAHVVPQQMGHFFSEGQVLPAREKGFLQFAKGGKKDFRNMLSPEGAEGHG